MHHSHFILGGLLIMSIIVSGTDGATLYMPTAAYDSILVMSLMGAENHIAARLSFGRTDTYYGFRELLGGRDTEPTTPRYADSRT